MALTMPQIIMLNHAATVNRLNSERRYEAKNRNKSRFEEDSLYKLEREEYEKMNPSQQSNYLASIGQF
jgi:hypothetical protein